MTRKASDHMERVAGLGCVLCDHIGMGPTYGVHVHHIYDTADKSDFLTIPLCPDHHVGKNGFHLLGEREFNRRYKTSETKLLAKTLEKLTP